MRDLKRGDRVRVYDIDRATGDTCQDTGTVELVGQRGEIYVKCDNWEAHMPFHPKQCRRIVKRKAREWWLKVDRKKHVYAIAYSEVGAKDLFTTDGMKVVHVREVQKGKAP